MSNIDISAQTLSFLYSLLFGVALSACYDFIRVLHRKTVHSVLAIQIIDVLFFIISAFITFCFLMIYAKGQIRLYLLLGELLGFLLWSLTLSAVLQKILIALFDFFSKTLRLILKPLIILEKQSKKIVFSLKNKRILAKKP